MFSTSYADIDDDDRSNKASCDTLISDYISVSYFEVCIQINYSLITMLNYAT